MDFTRKDRWVLDRHKTPAPEDSTCDSKVPRKSERISFTRAMLNGTEVFAADIRNAYLQAPSTEKHYVICGFEFRLENVEKRAIMCSAAY